MTEIHVNQYLRPRGQGRDVTLDVDDEVAKMAEGMILSAEVLTTGEVAIYVRHRDEEKEAESISIAQNGPGSNSPTNVLVNLIREKHAQAGV